MAGHDTSGGIWETFVGLAVASFVLIELLGILGHLKHLRLQVEMALERSLRRWLLGNE
jgi:hypothetical protein